MPLINGQKMACAPCIRGHRSTKCNHSTDRVMVPVRKPGRPLSSCACPPGQSCACGGIKVAIPRKQKCRCGLDTANGDHDGHDGVKPEIPTPALTPSELPVSPTRNGVFRVQKPGPSSKQNGRKQSFDPAQLERIDPNSVNIIMPYNNNSMAHNVVNGTPSQGANPMHGMAFVPNLPTTGYHQPGVISYGPPLGYALVPIHSQLNSPALSAVQNPDSSLSSPPNGSAAPPTNGAIRSCCAPVPSIPPPPPQAQVQAPQASVPPKKSCCGGGSNEETQADQQALPNGNTAIQLQPSFVGMKHQQQPPFAVSYPNNSTVFTYPANLGTWSQPLNPAMWAQLQQGPQPQPNGAAFSSPLPLTPNAGTAPVGTSHECSCGPGCQCVGCLAHPFNPQTQQYVSAAWDYDIDVPYGNNGSDKNGSKPAAATNGKSAHILQTNGRGDDGDGTNGDGTHGHATTTHVTNGAQQAAGPEAGSPTQAQTPSDASGFNEELSASDFMFVNLPLYQNAVGMDGDSCGGSLAFCPCGDDCECVGCVIHNARPLDARQFEE